MSEHNLSKHDQSTYKPNHSVEMALVCVQNDTLLTTDNQNFVIVVLLDLSAVFDTVYHEMMLHRLSHDVGVVQNALNWFKSYLSDRVQSVQICDATSPARHLGYGVPQGSVLGPQLFSIYAAPVAKIIRKNNLMSHFLCGRHSNLHPSETPPGGHCCIAPSTPSESNTKASESTELGGSPSRRHHET